MVETQMQNVERMKYYGKKALRWALYGAAVGALIGSFAGCLTAEDSVYDSKGCITSDCDVVRMHHWGVEYDIPSSKVLQAEKDGLSRSGVRRKATASERSSIENERFVWGLALGALNGACLAGLLPFIACAWFFFLVLIEQLMSAFRAPVNRHEVRIKRGKPV